MRRLGTTEIIKVDMTGKRVVVTAGARGIGKAMADAFAYNGARVFICDLDEKSLQSSGYPGRVIDIGEAGAVDGFMQDALSELHGLDILVNNAGIAGPTALLEDLTDADVAHTLQVNLGSMFQCARHAIPALREAGGGSIINLSSAAGKFGYSRRTPYSASKWGVIGLTRSLAIELGPARIRVNALLPGAVDGARLTAMFEAQATAQNVEYEEFVRMRMANIDLQTFVTSQDIANMALYLASPFGATITAQAISVDGGAERLS